MANKTFFDRLFDNPVLLFCRCCKRRINLNGRWVIIDRGLVSKIMEHPNIINSLCPDCKKQIENEQKKQNEKGILQDLKLFYKKFFT